MGEMSHISLIFELWSDTPYPSPPTPPVSDGGVRMIFLEF